MKPPEPHNDPLPAVPLASVDESHAESPDDDGPEPDTAALQGTSIVSALAALASTAQPASTPTPAPQRRADSGEYDALRGFNPGATRRR